MFIVINKFIIGFVCSNFKHIDSLILLALYWLLVASIDMEMHVAVHSVYGYHVE